MLILTTPLEAYRADRAGNPTRESLTANDAELLRLGSLLYRITQAPASAGLVDQFSDEAVRLARVVTHAGATPGGTIDHTSIVPAVRAAVEVAEDGGALHLGDALLHLLALRFATEESVELGRIIAQRARIARKAGALEHARALYDETFALGTRIHDDELVGRAHIGFGIIARARGNMPESRAQLTLALAAAERAGNREIAAMAHDGLMVVAAQLQQFDEAMVHAWAAFRDGEGDGDREYRALVNVGQAMFDSGRPRVALRVFAAALSRKPPRRFSLPALGGAARAASILGNEPMVRRLVREIDVQSQGPDLRSESVWALGEAAISLLPFDPAAAEERRQRAHAEAVASGYHELAFRLETLSMEAPRAAITSAPSKDIAEVMSGASALEVAEEYAGV